MRGADPTFARPIAALHSEDTPQPLLISVALVRLCHHAKLFSEVSGVFHMVSSGPLTHPDRTRHVDLNLLTQLSRDDRQVSICQAEGRLQPGLIAVLFFSLSLSLFHGHPRGPTCCRAHVGPTSCGSAVRSTGTVCNVPQTKVQHFRSNQSQSRILAKLHMKAETFEGN